MSTPSQPTQDTLVAFEVKTADGWSYLVDVRDLPQVAAAVDITNSPPGKGRLAFTASGSADATITSLDTGRSAPPIQFDVNYVYPTPRNPVPDSDPLLQSTWHCGSAASVSGARLSCDLVAQLISDGGSTVSDGSPQSIEVEEREARAGAAAFAKGVVVWEFSGPGQCTVDVNVRTKKLTVASNVVGLEPDCKAQMRSS